MQQQMNEKSISSITQDGLKYWQQKCGDHSMPRWRDIDPSEIKSLLPNIVVIHVSHDPLDFMERITGDVILSHSSLNSMGKSWREYEGRGPESKIWKSMEDVVTCKQASFQSIPYVGPQKYFIGIETVICPVSEDENRVDRIIAFVDYIPRNDQQLEKEVALQHMGRFVLPS